MFVETVKSKAGPEYWIISESRGLQAIDELHEMAARLGLDRTKYREGFAAGYYRLAPGMRAAAMGMGAIPTASPLERRLWLGRRRRMRKGAKR